jgi:hypothetical protein
MKTNLQKAALLTQAIELLKQVDALQEEALGDSDVACDNHDRITEIIEDFEYDIARFEG